MKNGPEIGFRSIKTITKIYN